MKQRGQRAVMETTVIKSMHEYISVGMNVQGAEGMVENGA